MSKEIIQDRSIDLTDVGGIRFTESDHTYHNSNGDRYTGITTLLGKYHDHFDEDRTSTNKAIKDCVIDFFGAEKYDLLVKQPNGVNEALNIAKSIPKYLKTSVLNEVIKNCVIDSFGEEKYMLLEKQVSGYDNLHNSIEKLKKNKVELFQKVLYGFNKRATIVKFGNDKYKDIKEEYGGFENIINGLDDIKMIEPGLHETILDKKQQLLLEWKETNLRAITEGTIEHDKREQSIYDEGGYEFEGVWYEYVKGKNISNVTLDDVIVIPECMVWNHNMRLGGLADIFLFNKGTINVLDYKTNASIDLKPKINNPSFWNYMTGPCSTLLDLNFYHYSLQLKIYQRMALLIQPEFKAGKNVIIHTANETHYKYEDTLYDCHKVNDIVTNIFKELSV